MLFLRKKPEMGNSMDRNKHELVINGIALDSQNDIPIVLLQEKEGEKVLPVQIGPFEASAIIIEMENVHPPRPLTHDLFADFFRRHGFKMEHLMIYKQVEEKFYARIYYKKGFKKHSMEVRPSDGLALAIRLEAKIYCAEDIYLHMESSEEDSVPYYNDTTNDTIYLKNDDLETPLY